MFTVSINVCFCIVGRKRFFTHWLDSGFQTSEEILTWWKTISHRTTEWRQKTQQRRLHRDNPDLMWCSGFSWRKWKYQHKHRCRVNCQCCCYAVMLKRPWTAPHPNTQDDAVNSSAQMENQNTLQLHECFLPLTFTSTEAQSTDGYKNAFPVSTQRDLKQKEGSSRHWISPWDRVWWEMMEKHWNPTHLWRMTSDDETPPENEKTHLREGSPQ